MIHPTQKKLLELSQRYDLEKMGLRQIGKLIEVAHPQQVKYHLQKIGVLEGGKKKRASKIKFKKALDSKIISIPILGLANCGDPTVIAEERIEGVLPISKRLLPSNHRNEDLFAVKAVGLSMNKADINGKSIVDGDYVIVDNSIRSVQHGNYVLSIIGGLANIKRLAVDKENDQIVLQSESSEFFPPIHIHKDDLDDYIINGRVVCVIKQPSQGSELYYEAMHA